MGDLMAVKLIERVWRSRRVLHRKIWTKILSPRRLVASERYTEVCRECTGLEIGGPSKIFGDHGLLPLYKIAGKLDACNFSDTTIWEGKISSGYTYRYHKSRPCGFQYIADATDLSVIPSGKYDFLLASHVLEHIANPLKGFGEWIRVTKIGGRLIVIIPHKQGTFDRNRPVTKFEHLVEDFTRGVGEDDLAHLDEILAMHDFAMDPDVEGYEAFKQRALNNIQNRCLHQHVFDTSLVLQMLNYLGLQILAVDTVLPCHIVTLSRKVNNNVSIDNSEFLLSDVVFRVRSPFSLDH
jgi:predicted SAM-dependent methyltransferase